MRTDCINAWFNRMETHFGVMEHSHSPTKAAEASDDLESDDGDDSPHEDEVEDEVVEDVVGEYSYA